MDDPPDPNKQDWLFDGTGEEKGVLEKYTSVETAKEIAREYRPQ